MFTKPNVYCDACLTWYRPKIGEVCCLGCGRKPAAMDDFLNVARELQKEMKRLMAAHPIHFPDIFHSGLVERRIGFQEALSEITRLCEAGSDACTFFTGFPRMEVIGVTVRHMRNQGRVFVHEDHYSSWLYGLGGCCVPYSVAFNDPLGSVFSKPDEDTERGMTWHELFRFLRLLQAQNDLWRALYADRFFCLPENEKPKVVQLSCRP